MNLSHMQKKLLLASGTDKKKKHFGFSHLRKDCNKKKKKHHTSKWH